MKEKNLICTLCNCAFDYKPEKGLYNLKKHIKTDKHIKRLTIIQNKENYNKSKLFNKEERFTK